MIVGTRVKIKCELCQVFDLFSGNFAEFKCPAEGIPTPTIEWLRNGKPYKSRFMGSVSIKFSNLNQRVVCALGLLVIVVSNKCHPGADIVSINVK